MTAIGISCIIHSATPCQEQFLSTMSVNSGAANRLTEEYRRGGEADCGSGERQGQVSRVPRVSIRISQGTYEHSNHTC